jgi:hypothetical protein
MRIEFSSISGGVVLRKARGSLESCERVEEL